MPSRVLIAGAAGRDFHNFNVVYRENPSVRVVAFTAAQIPGISGRRYPPSLAGPLYPEGIPIEDEVNLEDLCVREQVDSVVFAYSDVSHAAVMHVASRALATGADFVLLGPAHTMLPARLPVIAISAIRTGCGKSQTARWLGRWLRQRGWRVAVIRHPMPYGDLERQRVQRFASRGDLDGADCTAEEREEYEPHIADGNVVFAGVDYQQIIAAAEQEAELIVWDGGNNDFPFVRPDLHLVMADALRPGQTSTHHPGETVLRMADVVIVNKVDAASAADVQHVIDEVRDINPRARIVRAASPVGVADPAAIRGKRVLVVEDGPTVTHGGMPYGAGYVAATTGGVAVLIDPRRSATPAVREIFQKYPHISTVLPAVGYGHEQLQALRETINRSEAEIVLSATPIDLASLIRLDKPVVRVRYEYADAGAPTLGEIVSEFLGRLKRQ
jgi:predicted GTPase